MPALVKGTTFATGQQVSATNLNDLVDAATFASGAVDNSTTQLSSGAIIVKDGGVTPAKLSTGAPTWDGSGNQTVTGRINLNGGQLVFPATQVPSANPNALDDYEEGTWTPTLSGATTTTYTLQTGTYTKIGRLVVAHCRLSINSVGDGSKTLIAGLPFSAAAQQAGSVSYFAAAATNLVWATAYTNGSTVQIGTMTAAASGTGTADFFGNGTDVMLTVIYHV